MSALLSPLSFSSHTHGLLSSASPDDRDSTSDTGASLSSPLSLFLTLFFFQPIPPLANTMPSPRRVCVASPALRTSSHSPFILPPSSPRSRELSSCQTGCSRQDNTDHTRTCFSKGGFCSAVCCRSGVEEACSSCGHCGLTPFSLTFIKTYILLLCVCVSLVR